jgi:hypothetical protein
MFTFKYDFVTNQYDNTIIRQYDKHDNSRYKISIYKKRNMNKTHRFSMVLIHRF